MSCESAPRACFRSPQYVAAGLPASRSCSAIRGDFASVTAGRRRSSLSVAGATACQRSSERSERRPLTSAMGTPHACVCSSRLGHNSDSTTSKPSGRQRRRKRRMVTEPSAGRCWSSTRGPRCSMERRANAVAVLAVMSTADFASRASSMRTSGRAETVSPTDAPCTQSK